MEVGPICESVHIEVRKREIILNDATRLSKSRDFITGIMFNGDSLTSATFMIQIIKP